MGKLVELCSLEEIKEGEIKSFDIENGRIMLVNDKGGFFAVDRICTHAGADLSTGFLSGGNVICPLHLSAFSLADGQPTNPPATTPIKTYAVKIEGGKIFVEV